LFLLGDTHGRYEKVQSACQTVRKEKLIILGDFGFVFHKLVDGDNLERLSKLPSTILFLDGNHENFPALEEFPKIKKFGGTVSKLAKNVFWLRRGQVYCIDGYKVLTIGGAFSIDKGRRAPGVSWWGEENLSCEEIEYTLKNIDANKVVDFVLTHTCPTSIINKMNLSFSSKLKDSNAEFFESILTDGKLSFCHWYFGHFHEDLKIDDKFTCVNKELIEIKPKSKL